MKLSPADWRYLRGSLLGLSACLLLVSIAMGLAERTAQQARLEQHQVQQQLLAARQRLHETEEDFANIAQYATEYASLVDHQIVGKEQRLDWMEGLEKIRQRQQLIDFKYTISPQSVFVPTPALDSGDFILRLSGLKLEFALRHEVELLQFLSALQRDVPGWLMIDRCQIERSAPDSEALSLTAECSGGWLTLNHKN